MLLVPTEQANKRYAGRRRGGGFLGQIVLKALGSKSPTQKINPISPVPMRSFSCQVQSRPRPNRGYRREKLVFRPPRTTTSCFRSVWIARSGKERPGDGFAENKRLLGFVRQNSSIFTKRTTNNNADVVLVAHIDSAQYFRGSRYDCDRGRTLIGSAPAKLGPVAPGRRAHAS